MGEGGDLVGGWVYSGDQVARWLIRLTGKGEKRRQGRGELESNDGVGEKVIEWEGRGRADKEGGEGNGKE